MATDNIQGLETLEAWRKSKNFAVKVYQEILPLLQEEKWNLNQQIRRSRRICRILRRQLENLESLENQLTRKLFPITYLLLPIS